MSLYAIQKADLKILKMKTAYVVGMMRSHIGKNLSALSPQELCLQVLKPLFLKNNVKPEVIDFFAVGSAISLQVPDLALHKEIALRAGMTHADAESMNKACSSGLISVYRGAQSIWMEGADVAVVGGVDIMSQDKERSIRALTDPIAKKQMYLLCDEKTQELGITKEQLDWYSFTSYKRAHEHLFDHLPYATDIVLPNNGNLLTYDELVTARGEMTFERISGLKPVKGCQLISPASSSQWGDGAAFLILASPRACKEYGLRRLAKFVAFARTSGDEPRNFVIRPVEAVRKVLKRAKQALNQIDLFFINEAFATSPINFMSETSVLWEKVNPVGGAIAGGHPLGMSGTKLSIDAICQLIKLGRKRAIISLCNGDDEATAAEFETA